MAGIDAQAMAQPFGHRHADAFEFGLGGLALRFGVGAGMQLDDRRAGAGSGFDLRGIGVDEQRHADAGLGQQADRVRHRRQGAGHFQPALGGQLGAFFRHQADVIGLDRAGDLQHFRRHRAFQVHAGAQPRPDGVDVGVLNVAAVFAQMQRDQVGAGVLGAQRRRDRVGIGRVALLPQGRDVIDVYTKFYHCTFVVSSQPPPSAL